ncbi:MAG: hypothetical protein R3F49_07080 [Planctomycetota bacterium]
MQHSLLFAVSTIALAGTAVAQLPDVAIVAAASASLTDCRYTDVQTKLLATGRFASVDLIDCQTQTPTLQDLAPYEAVLTWTNTSYQSGDLLGDVFADYVDAGGGVVVAIYATGTTTVNRWLGGRWLTGGYEVIQTQGGTIGGASSLGNILVPGHPLMAGVTTFSSAQGARPTSTTLVQGQVIAEWLDGKILVAEGANPRRVDLGMYPPSSDCSATFWDSTTDGATLMANALEAVANGVSPGLGSNYCAANANSTGATATMSAAGSSAVVDNDLTLTAAALPNNAFGFFLTSQTQGAIANPGGSQGVLCLGGSIGRYVGAGQIQNSGAVGEISLVIDLTQFPTPTGFVSVLPGQSWNFTAWYRDVVGGSATSNFANGLEITFQ